MPAALAFAPIPALAAALLTPGGAPLVFFPPPLRMTLTLDVPAALLLGIAALLWIVAGAYAATYLRGKPNAGRFAEWWLLTLSGSLGVFMAADLVSFYLTYSVVSLAAYGLVVHDGTPGAWRAGGVYVALAVLGEAFLLMAFVFMAEATPNGSLLIRDAVAALPASPWRDASLALLILGFGLKIGLVPGHVWMPLAYPAAPTPAAAVLSGAAVKAGVIGLIRFLPLGVAMPAWGEALAAAGMFSAFYGVVVGITQDNPRTVLAYSSVSQMGLLAAVLGMGWAAGDADAGLGASFSAAHHLLVKRRAVSCDWRCRCDSAAPMAGVVAGGGLGARARRPAPHRGRSGEAGGKVGIWGGFCRGAGVIVGGRQHIADAAFPSPSRRDQGNGFRGSVTDRAYLALAGDRVRRGCNSLDAISDGQKRHAARRSRPR